MFTFCLQELVWKHVKKKKFFIMTESIFMTLFYLLFIKILMLILIHQDKQLSLLQDKAMSSQPERHHLYK